MYLFGFGTVKAIESVAIYLLYNKNTRFLQKACVFVFCVED